MNKFARIGLKSILYLSLLGVSSSSTYLFCYLNKSEVEIVNNNNEIVLTPQEKLINSLTSIQKFDINADIKFTFTNTMDEGKIQFNGSGDLSNLEEIKLDGSMYAKAGLSSINADIGYYDNNIYIDFNDSHIYFPTENILDFVQALPSLGINISLPDEVANLNISELESDLLKMEYIKDVNGYYFIYELNDFIKLYFTSDDEFNFTGIRTNRFFYQDIYFSLNASLNSVENTAVELINPTTVENAPRYIDFSSSLTLFNGMYKMFSSKENRINVKLDVKNQISTTEIEDLVNLDLDFTYDLNNMNANINGNVVENENHHYFDVSLLDSTLYANYNDALKFSIKNSTTMSLIDYVFGKISNETIDSIFDKLSTNLNDLNIVDLITKFTNINNFIIELNVVEDTIYVTINPSSLGLDAGEFIVEFNFTKEEFLGLSLTDLNINGTIIDLSLKKEVYSPITVVTDDYAPLDDVITTLPHIEMLTQQKKFRLEFNANVINSDSTINPITIDGGLQFDLTDDINNGYGYGSLVLKDRDNYVHDLFIDVKDKNEVLFKYNEKMKGKFKTQTVLDIIDLGTKIFNEKDEHFMEIFGDILNTINESEIAQILSTKNYGKLLASNIISNLKSSNAYISFDIDAAIIGLNDKFNVRVNYEHEEGKEYSTIKSLSITDLNVSTEEIDFTIELKDFNDNLESTRLPVADDYLDFSDIEFLLELGINTSKVNDWQFTSIIGISFAGISLGDLERIPLNMKIKNEKGNVKAIIELPNIPVIAAINAEDVPDFSSKWGRKTTFYYADGYFYGQRKDTYTPWFGSQKTKEYTFKATTENFMSNIINYLCDFGLGLNEWIRNKINTSSSSGPTEDNPIHYESVLNDFNYNSVGDTINNVNYPYFFIDINLAEITKNEQLSALKIKIYRDVANNRLYGLNIYFVADVGISISLNMDLQLVNFGETIDLTEMNSFISAHQNDEVNVIK